MADQSDSPRQVMVFFRSPELTTQPRTVRYEQVADWTEEGDYLRLGFATGAKYFEVLIPHDAIERVEIMQADEDVREDVA